jgi:hypothetical protein
MIAVIDEAMVTRGKPAYILAAVLLADDRRAIVRAAAQRVVPKRRRFHFHQEEPREKRAMMDLIADEAAAALALVAVPCPGRERENIRQRLLVELATLLGERPAVELTIESRGPDNDRRDRMTLVQARRDGSIPGDMAHVHRQPTQEPLLWLADGLAGAARCGLLLRDQTWLGLLPAGLLQVRRVSPPDLRRAASR